MNQSVESKEINGKLVEVFYDEYPENPRKMNDYFSKMVCFHEKYQIGDKNHPYDMNDFDTFADLNKQLIKNGAYVILPIYMYEHSGVTIKTTPFSDRFDSGMIGFIYVNKDVAIAEGFELDRKSKKQITALLEAEIKEYAQYLEGNVYKIVISEDKTCDMGCQHKIKIASYYGLYSIEEAYEVAMDILS